MKVTGWALVGGSLVIGMVVTIDLYRMILAPIITALH